METRDSKLQGRVTRVMRDANDKQWYKDFIDRYSNGWVANSIDGDPVYLSDNSLDYRRMVINYDLYNNILHSEDFEYMNNPVIDSIGKPPANLTNKDIISTKIKAIISMEREKPFDWNVIATNPEATTRREEQEDSMLSEYVVQSIMQPIQQQVQQAMEQERQNMLQQQQQMLQQQQQQEQMMQQQQMQQQQMQEQGQQIAQDGSNAPLQAQQGDIAAQQGDNISQGQISPSAGSNSPLQRGSGLTSDEEQQLQRDSDAMLQSMTPPEVYKYMRRKYKDPAEVLCSQMLEYIIRKEDIREKFSLGFKDGLIAGKTIFWVGILNRDPVLRVVNPLGFNYDRVQGLNRVEDGEWASYTQYLGPGEIISSFGAELSEEDIDRIYEQYDNVGDGIFNIGWDSYNQYIHRGVKVVHCEWKALKKIKFVSGIDIETGEPYVTMVDESYKKNEEVGDIELQSLWIPTKFEGYKIGKDIYVGMREVPGQHRDIDNLYECKLSYVGNAYDATNSVATSAVDRMKYYQYLYNIIWYRIELLTAKDDGKKIMIDGGVLDASKEVKFAEWLYNFKVNNIGLINRAEDGNKGLPLDIRGMVSEIDMSISNDIEKYIKLSEYIEQMCANSIGITKQLIEGIDMAENKNQRLYHTNILASYFSTHRDIKRRVLERLIEQMKVAYSTYQPEKLSYFLDDMSIRILQPDYELFDNSTYGIFITDNPKVTEMLDTIKTLSQAALQNQKVELSDVIKILNINNVEEAQEMLEVAEAQNRERMQQQQQQEQQARQQELQMQQQMQEQEHQFKMQYMITQEKLRGEYALQRQTILSMGFNEDKDLDDDGTPDVLEVYKAAKSVDIKEKKLALDREKMEERSKEHQDNIAVKRDELALKHKTLKNMIR